MGRVTKLIIISEQTNNRKAELFVALLYLLDDQIKEWRTSF